MYMNGSDASCHAQKKKSFKEVPDTSRRPYVQTRISRVEFLGGAFFIVPASVPVSVPVSPQTRHSQCNVVQSSLSPTPLMDHQK